VEIYDDVLEKFQIPFVFTLYPGGGFKLYNTACENFLQKVNNSPLFKGVIVTQQVTFDYLTDRKLINEDKVLMIYGAPYELKKFELAGEKRYFKKNKDTLDICFVSGKYTASGVDKGFDVFCQVAFSLSRKYDFIRFHVVGGFLREDLLYDVPADSISFYGYRNFEWFKEFYCGIDAIVSPVKPHVLSWGAFDGFPTGAVEEAGLFGAVMITSDPMGDNVGANYKNWDEMIIVESHKYSVIGSIEKLIEEPYLIEQIAIRGKKRVAELCAPEVQLHKRATFLKDKMFEEKIS
jgi:glycosyltransferase involved in cell wall biosynthesis